MSRAPYKYLDSYGFEDADLYFGREEEIIRTVGGILSARLLVLFAASGSGKTSLINAGVRPELEKRHYRTLYCRPHGDPLSEIHRLVARFSDAGVPAAASSLPELMRLYTRVGGPAQPRPLVVFLDQFEEFFICLRHDPQARAAFAKQLADVVFDTTLPVYFVLSLRDDYFVRLNEFREEIPSIFQNNANVQLRPLRRDDARRAIMQPATAVGLAYQENLVERMITDLEGLNPGGNGVLPITLQMVCHRLWQRASSNGNLVTEELYDQQLGGASHVIDRQIYDALAQLPANARRTLPRLFPRLITEDDTRQLRSFAELSDALRPRAARRLHDVLARLTDMQLVRAERLGDAVYYEFSHDYLVPRIQAWLQRYEQDVLRRRSRYGLLPALAIASAVLAVAAVRFASIEVHLSPGLAAEQYDELYVTRGYDPFGLHIGTSLGTNSLLDHEAELKLRNGHRLALFTTTDWRSLADLLADGPAARLLLATGAPSAGVERLLKHVAYAGPTAADAEAGFLIARDLSDERSEVTAGLLQALRGGDVKLRAAAAITAGNLGRADAAVVEELAKLLATDPGTVRAATEALSEIAKADRAAAHRLLAVSRSDPHAFMMATLALSASGRHEPDVRAALAERVRESDPSAAIAAAMGLAEQGVDAPGAADALVSVLKGQYFEFCRPDCAAALLGKLGNSRPEVVAALFAAANGNDRTAVVAAADALRRLGKANRALIAPLITALRSSPPETAAADTLRRLGYGTPEVVHALALTIATFGPPAVVFRALGELGGSQPRAVSALMEVLESDDPGTPAAAAAALERLRQTAPDTVQRAEEDLLRTVNDPDQTDPAAQAAAIKLAWLGRADDAVIGRLIEALSAEYGQLNEPAARALGRLGKPEPRVIQALRASLARGGAPRAVTDALGILGQPDPQVIALLVKDLRDASRADAAATALARLGDASPEVIRGLQTALRYNLFFTAEDASSALGTLGQRRADWTDDYLLGLLAHHESAWRTTAAAVIAAREPRDGKLLERVVALRKDARPWVRLAAWDTQSRIEARNQRAAAAAPVDDK